MMSENINTSLIRSKLEKQRQSIVALIQEEKQKAGASDVYNPDRADLAYDYASRDRRSAYLRQLEDHLNDINEALKRIDQGTYGLCTNCGKIIATARLEARPESTLCVDCQQKREKGGF
jgi:DnaK suppressor protein